MATKGKELTPAQRKANARNQLFRQIYGCNLRRFIDAAVREGAITIYENALLENIEAYLKNLKDNRFKNTKEVGLNASRRCAHCKCVAHYTAKILDDTIYLCNKHKLEYERDNHKDSYGNYIVTEFKEINPNE